MIVISEHTLDTSLLEDKNLKILDLGACRGEFSYGIKEVYNISKAVLVEACPTNFNKIKQSKNFISLNKAVYHDPNEEYLTFNEDTHDPYSGSIVFDHFKNSMVTHKIKTITLDELILLFNLDEKEKIDILKVDIEGTEYKLLLNASKDSITKFKQISIEFHDFINPSLRWLNQRIIDRLESFGFVLKVANATSMGYGTNHYDTLFINKNN